MNNNKTVCPCCKKDITTNNISKHTVACMRKETLAKIKISRPNPRNTGKPGRNQFMKARDEGRAIPTQSAETKAKALATKIERGSLKHSQKTKDKIAVSMKRAVQLNPESYSSANRGRTKQIVVDGINLQGQWEVDFYLWAKANELIISRPLTGFKYSWNGERTYFPDFYIENLGFIEVKGYATDRDEAKWSQFPESLYVVRRETILEIRNGKFTIDKLKSLLYTS